MSIRLESDVATTDGRNLRRDRNRRDIVDALLALYESGEIEVSAAQIAKRAGLSERSLFRYFIDVDDLYRAAFDAQFERIKGFAKISAFGHGTPNEKVEHFVDQRLRLFNAIGNIGRASRALAHRNHLIQDLLHKSRHDLRQQTVRHFRTELAVLPKAERIGAVAAIEVLCSYESFDLMRRDQRLSAPATKSALTAVISKILN